MAGGLTYHFSAFKTSFNRAERGICKSRGCCCLFASQLSRHWSNKQQSSWYKKGGGLQRPCGPSGWVCAVRKRWTKPDSRLNSHTSKKRHQYGRHGCSWLKTQGRCHTRTLPTMSPHSLHNFHVLLLVWEELWFLVRIIPAEVGLVAGGPGSLWTRVSPAEGHV